jgi:hypothetical protein
MRRTTLVRFSNKKNVELILRMRVTVNAIEQTVERHYP